MHMAPARWSALAGLGAAVVMLVCCLGILVAQNLDASNSLIRSAGPVVNEISSDPSQSSTVLAHR